MSAQNTQIQVTGHDLVIPRVSHADAPWNSNGHIVDPMLIEDDRGEPCDGSLAAMSPWRLISTSTRIFESGRRCSTKGILVRHG